MPGKANDPNTLCRGNVRDACLRGAQAAIKNYEKWHQGIDRGHPESLIQIEIARHLRKRGWLVTLEEQFSKTASDLPKSKVNQKALKALGNKRCDIMVWKSPTRPIAAIEVKRGVGRYEHDHQKMRTAMEAISTIRFGMFVCTKKGVDETKFKKTFKNLKKETDALSWDYTNRPITVGEKNISVASFVVGR